MLFDQHPFFALFKRDGNRAADTIFKFLNDGLFEVFSAINKTNFSGGNGVFKLFDDGVAAFGIVFLDGCPW